jgi:phospho-N-acetylmuramoyl-pentapeptide-transferase
MQQITISIIALLISFAVGMICMPVLLPRLKKLKFGQNVRDDGPKEHLKKAGTPTMGGVSIIAAFLAGTAYHINSPQIVLIIITTLAFCVLGFCDDYIKVIKKRSLGLSSRQKLFGQILISAGFCIFLVYYPSAAFLAQDTGVLDTSVLIPFFKGKAELGFLYFPMIVCVFIGGTNGVNFTDGLDGLNTGVSVFVCAFLGFAAFLADNGTMPVIYAFIGALIAFLFFNAHPAKVFMGDTGSLAIGGFIVSAAVILKVEFFLLIVGFIYVAEVISVIVQVVSYKTRGKRVFLMAPLHHHFELKGHYETQIVAWFCCITAIMSFLGALGLLIALG